MKWTIKTDEFYALCVENGEALMKHYSADVPILKELLFLKELSFLFIKNS